MILPKFPHAGQRGLRHEPRSPLLHLMCAQHDRYVAYQGLFRGRPRRVNRAAQLNEEKRASSSWCGRVGASLEAVQLLVSAALTITRKSGIWAPGLAPTKRMMTQTYVERARSVNLHQHAARINLCDIVRQGDGRVPHTPVHREHGVVVRRQHNVGRRQGRSMNTNKMPCFRACTKKGFDDVCVPPATAQCKGCIPARW